MIELSLLLDVLHIVQNIIVARPVQQIYSKRTQRSGMGHAFVQLGKLDAAQARGRVELPA